MSFAVGSVLNNSMVPATHNLRPLIRMYARQAKKIHGWTLFDWLMRDGEESAQKHFKHMWELFKDGTIQPLTGEQSSANLCLWVACSICACMNCL